MIDVVIDVSCIYGKDENEVCLEINSIYVQSHLIFYSPCHITASNSHPFPPTPLYEKRRFVLISQVLSGQVDTKSVIRLSNNKVLYLREVNRYLAFICLLKSDVFEKQGINALGVNG
jgi:hypothetical protein